MKSISQASKVLYYTDSIGIEYNSVRYHQISPYSYGYFKNTMIESNLSLDH